MRKRVHQIKFRLDDDELMLLRRNCVKAICRWLSIFADYWYMAKSKSIQMRLFADLQKQVKGVGRNVNQITRLAHISGKGIARNFASNFRSAGEDRAAA